MRRIVLTIAIAGFALVPLAACGDDDDNGGGAATTTPGSAATATSAAPTSGGGGGGSGSTITIDEFAFPAETHVAAGEPVSVTNNTGSAHTITAEDGTFNEEIPAGETIEFVVNDPGEYDYHCNFHSSMTGTLVVE